MFSKELEEFIDAALADGTLTEKERAVLYKRSQAEGVDPNLHGWWYFRLLSEQHCIIVPFLFRYPIRQPVKYFAQTKHDRLDRTWVDLYQIDVLTITRLGRKIEFMQGCTASECQLRCKDLISKDGNQGTTYNQVLLNLGIINPRCVITPLLYGCSVNHKSSFSI